MKYLNNEFYKPEKKIRKKITKACQVVVSKPTKVDKPIFLDYKVLSSIAGELPEKSSRGEYEYGPSETIEKLHEFFPGYTTVKLNLSYPEDPDFTLLMELTLRYEIEIKPTAVCFNNEELLSTFNVTGDLPESPKEIVKQLMIQLHSKHQAFAEYLDDEFRNTKKILRQKLKLAILGPKSTKRPRKA